MTCLRRGGRRSGDWRGRPALWLASIGTALLSTSCAQATPEFGDVVTLTAVGGSNPTTAIHAVTGKTYIAWVETRDGESNVLLASMSPDGTVTQPVGQWQGRGAMPHLQAPAQVAVGAGSGACVVLRGTLRSRPCP